MPEVIENYTFTCSCKDPENCTHSYKIMWQGGARIYKWQLNEKELEQYYPEDYRAKYPVNSGPCPICGKDVSYQDKRGVAQHLRNVHPEAYKANKKIIGESKDLEEMLEKIKNA